MAPATSGKGKTTRGSRGHGKQPKASSKFCKPNTSAWKTCGQKFSSHIINEVVVAYHEGSSAQVRQLIVEWEDELNQKVGILDIDLDDWKTLVPGLGRSWGRSSQYK